MRGADRSNCNGLRRGGNQPRHQCYCTFWIWTSLRRWEHRLAESTFTVHFGCALEWPRERAHSALCNRHIGSPVQLQEAESVLCAVVDVGVSAYARHGEEIQFGSCDCCGYRKCVVEARITIDDEWKRPCNRAKRRAARHERCVLKCWPSYFRVNAHEISSLPFATSCCAPTVSHYEHCAARVTKSHSPPPTLQTSPGGSLVVPRQ